MAGLFITFEGIDGCGKSTQLRLLASELRVRGLEVVTTREPGGTSLGQKLRAALLDVQEQVDPLAELLVFAADRAQHVRQLLLPVLRNNQIVLSDRYADATAAYQGAGKGVSMDLIARLAEAAHPSLQPSRTLIFDCPYDVAAARLAKAGRTLDRFEREDRAFFERVRAAYLAITKREPQRVRLIDASASAAQVREQIKAALEGL